jgi:glycosyltransferase involved in cell wall biosynthesis
MDDFHNEPTLSIIVVSYNTGEFLEPTLDSIFAQQFKNFECIVIDGASTDGTLEKLKAYPQVRLLSEKDSCYLEAFQKGLKMARGKYVMQCCISDGYIDKDWFRSCIDAFERDGEISLVWGLPQYMSEDGKMLAVSYPQFYKSAPQKEKFFYYWLASFFWFPEGNFCVRKSVVVDCFPAFTTPSESRQLEPWLEFNFAFQQKGYMPLFLPIIANYGRIHGGQLGRRELFSGAAEKKYNLYIRKSRLLRRRLIFGGAQHQYHRGNGTRADYNFSRWHFIFIEILAPTRLVRNVNILFRNIARKILFISASRKILPKFVENAIDAKRQAKYNNVR